MDVLKDVVYGGREAKTVASPPAALPLGNAKTPAKTIKVFNLETVKTESERRADFDRWKQNSAFPAWCWDSWRDMETGVAPRPLVNSTIMSIQVKNLLRYAIALTEGNPHWKQPDRATDIWLQYDADLRVMDLSFREYRAPRDSRVRVVGLNMWWRRHGGAYAPESRLNDTVIERAPLSQQILAGDVSYWHNGVLAGPRFTPLPFPAETKLMLTTLTPDKLTPYIDEINRANMWYAMNQSLVFAIIDSGHNQLIVPAPLKWPAVMPAKDKLVRAIAANTGIQFMEGRVDSDMYQLDLLDLWHHMRMLPQTSPEIPAAIARLAAARAAWQKTREHRFVSQVMQREAATRNYLAMQVAGKRWQELSPKERDHVERQIKHRSARKDNPELRRVIRDIHRAVNATVTDTAEMRHVYEMLKRTTDIARAKPGDFVKLNQSADAAHTGASPDASNAHTGALCPHYAFLVRETLAAGKNPLGQIDMQPVQQACVQRFAERVPVNFKYYCSKCGELLMTEELDEFISFSTQQSMVSSTQDRDPIWAYILSECNQVVRRVRFTRPQNTRPFVLAIAQTLEPEMITQQTELQKSKTKSMDDIRNTMIIVISAYCFALVSKMIIDSPQKMRWNVVDPNAPGSAPTPHSTKQDAAGGGYIVDTDEAGAKKGGTPAEQAEQSSAPKGGSAKRQADAVRILSQAYNMIVDSNQNRITKIKDFGVDQIKPILLRAYEWARNVRFSTVETGSDAYDMSTSLINDPWYNLIYFMAATQGDVGKTDFTKLLGNKDPLAALCAPRPFEKAYRPKSGPGLSMRERAYLCLLDYADSGVYREFAVPQSPILIAWWKKWESIYEPEAAAYLALRENAIRPARKIYSNRGQVPEFDTLDISLIRCPDGQLHRFTEYVFATENGKGRSSGRTITLSLKEIKATGEVPNGAVLKDEKCGNCGWSKYAKADPKVRIKIAEELDRQNFYIHFTSRCPATTNLDSSLHDFPMKDGFVGDLPCKKCRFQRSFADTRPLPYYNKWRSAVHTERRAPIPLEPDRKLWSLGAKFDKWNVTMASILQIANVSGVANNLWSNIGMSEHRNFGLLRLGKINPQSTIDDAAAAARLVKLANWVYWVNTQYLLVRNHSRVVVPTGLKEVLEEEGVIAEGHKSLSELPTLLKNFASQLEYYKNTQGTKITCNFALHTLCSMLMQIRQMTHKKLGHRLFDYLVAEIVKGESMMSELEIAKMQTAATAEHEDAPDIDDDDYLEAGEAQDIMDKGTEDPFSLSGVDIETSNTGLDDEDYMT